MSHAIILPDRALLAVSGEERLAFLNTLLSADVAELAEEARFAALLTPQGKLLADVLCYTDAEAERVIIDFPADSDFAKRLRMYKLRAAVTLEPLDDWAVMVSLDGPVEGALSVPDPRGESLGYRVYGPPPADSSTERSAYDRARIDAVVPEGPTDLEPNKALLLESGFERLRGVDFRKGCFVGQEVTARMKYRNLGKKRIMAVSGTAPLVAGQSIMAGERTAGTVLSSTGTDALALMRHEFADQPLTTDDGTVRVLSDPDAPESV